MEEADEQLEASPARASRVSEASLQSNESHDFDAVLQGVLDLARALTKARYGIIWTTDSDGGLDRVLSSGATEAEHQQLIELPDGTKLFDHFSTITGPLRIADSQAYATSVGLAGGLPMTVWSGLVAPIAHPGDSVGTIYLGHSREDEEFTREDEETLAMFASHAALVIANARHSREERLANDRLTTLIDTSPVGVVLFDANTGSLLSFNREAERMMDSLYLDDATPEEILSILTIKRADGRELSLSESSLAEAMRASDRIRAEEIVIEAPGGHAVTTLVNASPVYSESGVMESFVITLLDMSRVDELDRLRAEFLATVSHELRGPLTAVKGSIANLLEPGGALDPAEVIQFHRIIDAQTDRMRDLIRDLLDVARIETATLTVYPEPADVAALIDEARNAFLISAGANNIQIDLAPDLPWVMADKMRIVQVLTNLLSNARRNSPKTSTVYVSASHDGLHVSVSVSDEGTGIPAASLPNLFRKFSRVGEGDGGDTGLGLAICKGLVEAHGGRIWAESDGPNLGSKFTFTLLVAEEVPSAAAPASADPAVPSTTAGTTRILVVDDDPQALRYARHALVDAGHQPTVTGDPKEALDLFVTGQPHLVLLDLMLPGSDGIELMERMLEIADVPVIFLSAYGQEEVVARAFDRGADDYVVKPFSPTELAARIRAALRKREVAEPPVPYQRGELEVHYGELRVTLAGQPVRLTAIEYRLLTRLSTQAGRTVTYARLLQDVWGLEATSDLRPVRTVIKSLRRKLGDSATSPTYVFTEPRVGYRLAGPDHEEAAPPA